MIALDSVTVELSGRTVLQDCSLWVARNEKVAVSGASGAGKSTVLRTLIGRHRPQSGRVVIDDKPLTIQNLSVIRSQLFYLPQDILGLGDETALEFLKMPFRLSVNRKRRFEKSRAASWFEALGLKPHLFESKLKEMSGGERKRLGMVLAALLERPIWILDELTSSVDEDTAKVLVDTVLGLRDTTVIAVTHDTTFMQRAGRHVIVRDGRIEDADGGGNGGS